MVNNVLLFVNYNEEIARTNLMAWKGCAPAIYSLWVATFFRLNAFYGPRSSITRIYSFESMLHNSIILLLWSGSVHSKSGTPPFHFCQLIDDLFRAFFTENNFYNLFFMDRHRPMVKSRKNQKKKQIGINTIEMNEHFHSDASGANNFVVRSNRMNIEYFISVLFLFFGPPPLS